VTDDLPQIVVEFVRPDGTRPLRGHRVRVSAGSGGVEGDIYHEAEAGVLTPVMGDRLPAVRRELSTRSDLVEHLDRCPRVRVAPRSADADASGARSHEHEDWMD
jgi:hypothetical protein